MHFRVESGNATDDRSHVASWDLLCKLTGRNDFLYVADCKLATAENMAHIHQRGGRFLSVLPAPEVKTTPPSAPGSCWDRSTGDTSTTNATTTGNLVDQFLDLRAGGSGAPRATG